MAGQGKAAQGQDWQGKARKRQPP